MLPAGWLCRCQDRVAAHRCSMGLLLPPLAITGHHSSPPLINHDIVPADWNRAPAPCCDSCHQRSSFQSERLPLLRQPRTQSEPDACCPRQCKKSSISVNVPSMPRPHTYPIRMPTYLSMPLPVNRRPAITCIKPLPILSTDSFPSSQRRCISWQ